jgi:hypothetical protein
MAEQRDNTGGGQGGSGAPFGPCQGAGSGLAESFRGQVDDLAAQARKETVRLAEDAREQGWALVRRRQDRLAARLGSVASALRDAGRRLDREVVDGLGEFVGRAAQQVDRASGYLRESEVSDMVRDAEDLARRHPAVFLGGTFATGFLLARFLKSSGERASWLKSSGPTGTAESTRTAGSSGPTGPAEYSPLLPYTGAAGGGAPEPLARRS